MLAADDRALLSQLVAENLNATPLPYATLLYASQPLIARIVSWLNSEVIDPMSFNRVLNCAHDAYLGVSPATPSKFEWVKLSEQRNRCASCVQAQH